uniref:Unannotated protein n=1 Tax=freshwater metagenome TaxID=449393 RepID=A0A6J5ZWJ4_9ZZZZ
MPLKRFLAKNIQANSPDPRRSPGEVAIDELLLESDRFEDLCTAVRLNRRDAHLGDRLQKPLAKRLDDIALGLVRAVHSVDVTLGSHFGGAVEQQIRVDCARPVADQRGEVMNLARLSAFKNEPCLQPVAKPHQVMVDGGDCQQRRDRRPLCAHPPIGQDHDRRAGGDGIVRLVTEVRKAAAEAVRTFLNWPGDVERVSAEDVALNVAERLKLLVAQDRLIHHELVSVLGRLAQQVALGAN